MAEIFEPDTHSDFIPIFFFRAGVWYIPSQDYYANFI